MDKTEIKDVIIDRHDEASEVKQCFTNFAFQGLLLTAAFFGFLTKFYPTDSTKCMPFVLLWLFCLVIILVIIRIVEIGIHKYSTANRNYGYVLHLDRTYDYEQITSRDDLEEKIRQVGWEEGMFAWRIIQPIISEEIYKQRTKIERFCFPFLFTERDKYRTSKYHWWNTEHLINETVDRKLSGKKTKMMSFHPGSYLQKTQRLMHILCMFVFAVFSISYLTECICFHKWLNEKFNWIAYQNIIILLVYFLIWLFFLLLLLHTMIRQRERRHILEKGLLSIQSCAVVWRLVILAHLKTVEEGTSYKGYTLRLVDNANIIIDNLHSIHETVMKNIWSNEIIYKDNDSK